MTAPRRKRYRIDTPRMADGSFTPLPLPPERTRCHRLCWIDADGRVGQSITVFDRDRCMRLAAELNAGEKGAEARRYFFVYVHRH